MFYLSDFIFLYRIGSETSEELDFFLTLDVLSKDFFFLISLRKNLCRRREKIFVSLHFLVLLWLVFCSSFSISEWGNVLSFVLLLRVFYVFLRLLHVSLLTFLLVLPAVARNIILLFIGTHHFVCWRWETANQSLEHDSPRFFNQSTNQSTNSMMILMCHPGQVVPLAFSCRSHCIQSIFVLYDVKGGQIDIPVFVLTQSDIYDFTLWNFITLFLHVTLLT